MCLVLWGNARGIQGGGRREEQVVNLIGVMDGRAGGGEAKLILGQNMAKYPIVAPKGHLVCRGAVL